MKRIAALLMLLCGSLAAQDQVRAIQPPVTPLPSEAESAGITRFSFIVYGDTRSAVGITEVSKSKDGEILQVEHSALVDSMLTVIKERRATDFPVRFVLQSGDAVAHGQNVAEWNVSFVPVIDRLIREGDVPYFFAAGNHDVAPVLGQDATKQNSPGRQAGLKNTLDAIGKLIPPDGSPRRLAGYPVYSLGFGNAFFVALDSNLIGDETQYQWIKSQLEGLDRARYEHVYVFFHHHVFSSGRHGVPRLEPASAEIQKRYMPLFREQHVEIVFSGHEHLFDHYVEHYTDDSGEHRMDLVVSGGGGAPTMPYVGEPDFSAYVEQNKDHGVRVEHAMRPGAVAENPNHYVVVQVDGGRVTMEIIAPSMPDYRPYRSNQRTVAGGR